MDLGINWDFLIKLFVVGILPWIIQSKKTGFYFGFKDFDLSFIFNCFASIFASSILISYYFLNPFTLINLCAEWIFFIASIGLAIIYFWMFLNSFEKFRNETITELFQDIKYLKVEVKDNDETSKQLEELNDQLQSQKDKIDDISQKVLNERIEQLEKKKKNETIKVEKLKVLNREVFKLKSALACHLVLYVSIFCLLSLGFLRSKIYRDYTIVEGVILDAKNSSKIKNASISFFASNIAQSAIETTSNQKGEYSLIIDNESFNQIDSISIIANNYDTVKKGYLGGVSLMNYTGKILLTRRDIKTAP